MFAPENAGLLWALTFGVGLIVFAFWIVIQWRTFAKAGLPGSLALLNLAIVIPMIGVLIVLGLQVWFAFADWPALKRAHPTNGAP
jgi:hypothetical protein